MRMRCSGSVTFFELRFELFENGGEGVLLNQEEQSLFGLEVVVKSRQ